MNMHSIFSLLIKGQASLSHCLNMAPNHAPSAYDYDYESIIDIYVDIIEACRPFYSLKENEKKFEHNSIPPRLDDALEAANQSGDNCANNVSRHHRGASLHW
jgi:hypothetical protein